MFRKPSRIIFNRLIEFRVPEHRLPGCHPDGISEPGRDGTNPKDRGMQNILGFGPFGTLRASDDGGRPFPARCRRVIIRTDWIDPSASEERAVTMTWRDALLRILMPATICLLPMFGPTVRADDHARADHPEDARLEALFREYLDAWFADEPLTATKLGDHRFDDRLDDLSSKAREDWVERDQEFLRSLPERVDYDALSRDGQIDYEVFQHHLDNAIWLTENFRPFEDDPRTYVGYTTEGVYLLFTQSTRPYNENLENAISRIEAVPRIIATARETLNGPSRVKTETAILQTQGAIDFYEGDAVPDRRHPRWQRQWRGPPARRGGGEGGRRPSGLPSVPQGGRAARMPATTGGSAPNCSPRSLNAN